MQYWSTEISSQTQLNLLTYLLSVWLSYTCNNRLTTLRVCLEFPDIIADSSQHSHQCCSLCMSGIPRHHHRSSRHSHQCCSLCMCACVWNSPTSSQSLPHPCCVIQFQRLFLSLPPVNYQHHCITVHNDWISRRITFNWVTQDKTCHVPPATDVPATRPTLPVQQTTVPDKIFHRQLPNSPTFPATLDKWSPCKKIYTHW